MPKIYSHTEFLQYIVTQYFEVKSYDTIKEKYKVTIDNNETNNLLDYFEESRKRYNHPDFHTPESALNIVEVNIDNFAKKSKMNYPFIEKYKGEIKIFIFEYVRSYYNRFRNNNYDYTTAELTSDIYVYNTKTNKVIAHLEAREDVSTFKVYFQESFIGHIHTDEEYQNNKISVFMTRLAAFYIWLMRRKTVYSSTTISEQRMSFYRKYAKKTKWIIREDYLYKNKDEEDYKERYLILPFKLNVQVQDSHLTFDF